MANRTAPRDTTFYLDKRARLTRIMAQHDSCIRHAAKHRDILTAEDFGEAYLTIVAERDALDKVRRARR